MFDEEIKQALDGDYGEPSNENILKNIDVSMYTEEQLLEQEQIVEAILFMMGDSVTVDTLAVALSKDHDIALAAVERLVLRYENEYKNRGMKVIRINHKYQMVANNKYFQNLVLVASKPQKPVLTDAVLETLSIIAYKQPITKPEIEDIRSVKSDFAVNRLIEYGLVEEKGRLDAPGRPIILGTTEEFLLRFGLESTDDLPILPPAREAEIQSEVEKELTESLGEPVHIDNGEDNNKENDVEENVTNENTTEENTVEENLTNKNNDVKDKKEDGIENNNNEELNNSNDEIKEDENSDAKEDVEDDNKEEKIKIEDDEDILPNEEEDDNEYSPDDFNEVDKNLMDRYNDQDKENIYPDNNYDVVENSENSSHERKDIQHDEKVDESDDKEPQ